MMKSREMIDLKEEEKWIEIRNNRENWKEILL